MRPTLTIALVAAATLACSGMAEPAVSDGTVCGDACVNFHDCGLQAYGDCMAECPLVDPEIVQMFASASCPELRDMVSGGGGGGGGAVPPRNGSACVTSGIDDCPLFQMCCVQGRDARRGERGVCLTHGTCRMPR